MRKRLIGAAVVVALVIAAFFAQDYYFNDRPVDLADSYREDATPAATGITKSMDSVFDSFDGFLRASTIRKSRLKNVDDIDELRRRFLPVYADADDALVDARKKVKRARKAIKDGKDDLFDTPSGRFIDDSDPIKQTEDVAKQSKDYLSRVDRYLNSYDDFLAYEAKDLKLRRRELDVAASDKVGPDESLESIKSKVDSQLKKTQSLRKARQELKPARDTEKLDDNALEYLNVTIDYLQGTAGALDALDADALDSVTADYLGEVKRVGERSSDLIAELSLDSGLSEASRSLSERADDLQDAIATTGSGAERKASPRRRPPPLAVPKQGPDSGDSGGSDQQLS